MSNQDDQVGPNRTTGLWILENGLEVGHKCECRYAEPEFEPWPVLAVQRGHYTLVIFHIQTLKLKCLT